MFTNSVRNKLRTSFLQQVQQITISDKTQIIQADKQV